MPRRRPRHEKGSGSQTLGAASVTPTLAVNLTAGLPWQADPTLDTGGQGGAAERVATR
jgi:hypothetical protein